MKRRVSLADRERRRRLEQERLGRAGEEERALQAHLQTLDGLERLRGGALRMEQGRIRARGRDGLFSLHEKGAIGEAEFLSGLRYRHAYEAIERGPPSQLQREAIPSTGPSEGLAWAERRAHLFGRLKAMEALARSEPELRCLRLCAGEGRTLRSIVDGGRSHGAAAEAIRAVLGAIAERQGGGDRVEPKQES